MEKKRYILFQVQVEGKVIETSWNEKGQQKEGVSKDQTVQDFR